VDAAARQAARQAAMALAALAEDFRKSPREENGAGMEIEGAGEIISRPVSRRPSACEAQVRRPGSSARATGRCCRWLPGEDLGGESLDDGGVLRGDVVHLHRIADDCVEFGTSTVGVEEKFPIGVADRELRAAVDDMAENSEAPFPHQRTRARAGVAEPDIARLLAVEHVVGGEGEPGELRKRGKLIEAGEDAGVVNAGGGHVAGPAHEIRHAHAALVETALAAAKRTGAAHSAVSGAGDRHFLRAIVAGKNYDGVVGDAECFQAVEQTADLGVEVAGISQTLDAVGLQRAGGRETQVLQLVRGLRQDLKRLRRAAWS